MEVSRRGFLFGLGALVSANIVEEVIPFNRVWSFPQKIRIANIAETEAITGNKLLTIGMITWEALAVLQKELTFTKYFPEDFSLHSPQIATLLPCRPTGITLPS